MRKYIKGFKTEFDGKLNYGIMNHSYDRPLVDHIVDVWKSLEIVKSIKIVKWSYSEEERNLNKYKYQKEREEVKKLIKNKSCKSIDDDRLGTLRFTIDLSTKTIDEKGNSVIEKYTVNKVLFLPIIENGYITLRGKKYYLIYQMVDKATYNLKNSVVLKSLMPIEVSRCSTDAIDGTDSSKIYKLPMYKIKVYNKEMTCLLYYASRDGGLLGALDYLGVSSIIKIVNKISNPDKYIYIKISSECFIEVESTMFKESIYVRSIVGMISDATSNRFNISMVRDKDVFLAKLTNTGSIEKGKDALVSFDRFLDIGTSKILLTPEINKNSVHALIRWMMMEFNNLRIKDSNSLYNQRLRVNEYIASLLTQDFSDRITKIIKMGSSVTIEDLKKFFKFSPFLLINKFQSSGILRFNESINDMSQFFSKFKYTTKGPHSIGGNGSKGGKAKAGVALEKRWLHPSAVGLVDLTVCSSSDPGLSGVISPFSKIDSMYFSKENEPDDVMYDLNRRITEILDKDDDIVIQMDCSDKETFYKVMKDIEDIRDNCAVYITSTNSIIINKGVIFDDDTTSKDNNKNKNDDDDGDNE